MASRRLAVPLAYPRRELGPRSVTRIDRHSLILVLGLLTLAAFAGVLYLSQASVAAELRFRLAYAQGEAQDLWQRNFALRQEIADRERLDAVEARASRLGMVDAPPGGQYIVCALPPAELALAGRPVAPAEAAGDGHAVAGAWARMARSLGWPEPGGQGASRGPLFASVGQ